MVPVTKQLIMFPMTKPVLLSVKVGLFVSIFVSLFFFNIHHENLGGESVKEISRRSGALVELDKTHVPAIANSGERLFKIRGTPDQIALAQQLMYEKVLNSPGGAGDLLPPLQFQQKFNLPLIGASSNDTWPNTADPYATNANNSSTDPYSQWANAYGQWPQSNSFDNRCSIPDDICFFH